MTSDGVGRHSWRGARTQSQSHYPRPRPDPHPYYKNHPPPPPHDYYYYPYHRDRPSGLHRSLRGHPRPRRPNCLSRTPFSLSRVACNAIRPSSSKKYEHLFDEDADDRVVFDNANIVEVGGEGDLSYGPGTPMFKGGVQTGASLVAAPMPHKEAFNNLRFWIDDRGGSVEPLITYAYARRHGWHLRATCRIPKSTVLLRVPRAAFIAQLHYHEDMNDLVWEMPLALSLLKEIKRKKSSEFYHYVNTMTREPQRLPYLFKESDFEMLQMAPMMDEINTRLHMALEFFKNNQEYIKEVTGAQELTLQEFVWAVATSFGRGVSFDGGIDFSLVPLVDLAKRELPQNLPAASVNQDESGEVSLIADRDIQEGEIITIPTICDNDVMMMRFGESVQNNPYDQIDLEFRAQWFLDGDTKEEGAGSSGDPILDEWQWGGSVEAPADETGHLRQWKLYRIRNVTKRVDEDGFGLFNLGPDKKSMEELLAVCRILSLDSEEDDSTTDDAIAFRTMGMGVKVEHAALTKLLGIFEQALNSFPTTWEQDERMLERRENEDGTLLSIAATAAVEYRLAKKIKIVTRVNATQRELKRIEQIIKEM